MVDAAGLTSVTAADLVQELTHQFEAAGLEDPNVDARTLVCGLLNIDLTDLVLGRGGPVSSDDLAVARAAAARRCGREPVHRILGRRSFFGLELVLSADTLEPRPDTETLLRAVLPFARSRATEAGGCRVLDLGTGSGAICLGLLSEIGSVCGVGTDISEGALETARDNARRAGLQERFETIAGSWFSNIEGTFDLIVSNPPYIPTDDISGLSPEVRDFDPVIALDGGADGLDAYRAIAAGAAGHLAEGGRVAIETGFDQCDAVTAVFEENGYTLTQRIKDFGGHDRVVVFCT